MGKLHRAMKGLITLKNPLKLESGQWLDNAKVAYTQYGEPNQDGSNVILICHTLSGDINILEQKEWWFIGDNQWIDPKKYCIIAFATLGSWHGSSSPIKDVGNQESKYGIAFPTVTVTDSVRAHQQALQQLGISKVRAIIGGSFGGFCVYTWLTLNPQLIDIAIVFQSAARCSAHTIGLFSLMRELICADPAWNNGNYEADQIKTMMGLQQAIALNRLFALSHHFYEQKLAPKQRRETMELTAGYWQPFSLVDTFINQPANSLRGLDPNALLSTLRASSLFDLERTFPDVWERWQRMRTQLIQIPCKQDWRYPPEGMEEIHQKCVGMNITSVLKPTSSMLGHGSFLHDPASLQSLLPFLNKVIETGHLYA